MMTEEKKKYHKRRGMSERILDVLSDGHWHSVQEVSKRIGYLETGTSAGIRTLRKKPYGKKNVVGKWLGGVYHYRLEEGEYGEKPLSYDVVKTIQVDLLKIILKKALLS